MSNIRLIHSEKPADIGNFTVGRILPFAEQRMVGPFAFIDHMGPTVMGPEDNLDVGPHPHIGLSTLTYLFQGAIHHRDALGNELDIKPGEVNWMTAGRGIVHSERTPIYLRGKEKTLHGLQIWVALPKHLEQMEPAFYHASSEDVPQWSEEGVHFRLIAGDFGSLRSPVPVYSPLFLVELTSNEVSRAVDLSAQVFGEHAIYILRGNITDSGHLYSAGQILIPADFSRCMFTILPDTVLFLLGGEPFTEKRTIYWNFVSSDRELIEKAKQDWQEQLFTNIPGENDIVPLPPQPTNIKIR